MFESEYICQKVFTKPATLLIEAYPQDSTNNNNKRAVPKKPEKTTKFTNSATHDFITSKQNNNNTKFSNKTVNYNDTPFQCENFNSLEFLEVNKNAVAYSENSNFCQNTLPYLPKSNKKTESIDTWACSDSKFLKKIGQNSGFAGKKMSLFNDSALFVKS